MGGLRLHLGDKLGLIRKGEWQFMWLTDPPLFEIDDGEIAAAHHPFTSPRVEDEQYLETAPEKVLARAYDLVLNGVEVGGGSIRIHRSELQDRAFQALGSPRKIARESSASCSTRSSTARRRTAASRSVSTAWPC